MVTSMNLDHPILIIIAIAILITVLIASIIPVGLWFKALVLGVKLSLFDLFIMKWRRIPINEIIESLIDAQSSGLEIKRVELEVHYLDGGNISNVVNGMITSKKAGLQLTFKEAVQADLNGINISNAIKENISKKYKG
jgi:uncharacterized protein YqfA (UPF0365 family)